MDLQLRAPSAVRALSSGTSRGVLLVTALLLLAGLLPGAASAAPERGALVVEGRGGTVTEWVLKDGATITQPVPTLTGGGDYAGVLIEALQPRGGYTRRLGALQVRAFRDRTKDVVSVLGADGQLEPGRYRVRLFGDGPVRVRWPLGDPDQAGLRVVPTTPMPVTFLGRAEPLPAGQGSARVDLPGSLPAGKSVILATLLDGTDAQQLRMCATTEPNCPGGLPARPPSPVPWDVPLVPTSVGTGEPRMWALHVAADPRRRSLRWFAEGHRLSDDRLRTAALIF